MCWSCLLRFLDEVQSHAGENKMSVQNLATVFGPNILRPRVEDPVTMMEGWFIMSKYHKMTKKTIHDNKIF